MTDPQRRWLATVLVVTMSMGVVATAAAATPLPSCTVADRLTEHRTYADWPRTLLDLTFMVPSSYAPSDLSSTANAGLNGGYSVRRHLIPDLRSMASAARAAGARFVVTSAYRSYATQRSTFDYWVRRDGYSAALLGSARAGHSEHQLGTTLDFRSYGGPEPWDVADWGTTAAGKWLAANAWRYGFVMSYPKGKTSVTCYQYEPWHFRYVGRDRAAEIRASRQTLRQFLWTEQTAPPPEPTRIELDRRSIAPS